MPRRTNARPVTVTIRAAPTHATLYDPRGGQQTIGGPDAVERLKQEHAGHGWTFDVRPFAASAFDNF